MTTNKTNPFLIELVERLRLKSREESARIWKDVARRLEKPRRSYAEVNMSRINRYTEENDVILVPGKVLGSGHLGHPVTVAALDFSEAARRRIESEKGECLSIYDLMALNPKGSGVKILK